jgi:hypothetical protein
VSFRRLGEQFTGRMRAPRVPRRPLAEFDFVARPSPDAEGLSLALSDVPSGPLERRASFALPHLNRGAEEACQELAECGEWFCSVMVEITNVRCHEYVSLVGCDELARRAKSFVKDILRERCDSIRSLNPSWRTPDVLALARHVHQTHDHADLPVLADALEDAGCDFALLLDHCRAACDHGVSCWALQLTLADPA